MAEKPGEVVSDGIWQKFELIQALKVVLVTCKSEEDPYCQNHT